MVVSIAFFLIAITHGFHPSTML